MELKMSKEEVDKFAFRNKDAMMILQQATSDYAGARCCLLNGLFTGLILASEAIEKMLKGFIYLYGGSKIKTHDLIYLKNELKKFKDYNLDRYDELFKRLNQHFQTRYPDNPDQSNKMSTSELNEIDELWIYLLEQLPMPDEVKYISGTYSCLFDFRGTEFLGLTKTLARGKWIMENNQALYPKLNSIIKKYKEIHEHLYSPKE